MNPDFPEEISVCLDRYLDSLYRSLSRVYYRFIGEDDPEFRNIHILSGILETILLQVAREHPINTQDYSEDPLVLHLISLGSDIPLYQSNERFLRDFDNTTRSELVREGLCVAVPDHVLTSMVDPLLMTRALHKLMMRVKPVQKRDKGEENHEMEQNSFSESHVFEYTFEHIIPSECFQAVIDPSCGTGEIILKAAHIMCRDVQSVAERLRCISSGVFAADRSLFLVLIVRFGLVLTILGRDISDKLQDSSECQDYVRAIRDNVRVGSFLFSPDLVHEFISQQEQKRAILRYRPLSDDWPGIPPDTPAILVTCPDMQKVPRSPEIRSYLCTHAEAYSPEPAIHLISTEKALKKFRYPSFIFLHASWLSDKKAGPFRRWLKGSRVNRIIIEDTDNISIIPYQWSCLHGDGDQADLSVVQVDTQGSAKIHVLEKTSLPDDDGWNLSDPYISGILTDIRTGSVPLSEYCLGALYEPGDISTFEQYGLWISIKAKGARICVISGPEPDPSASLYIRGPDFFLEGLISSSLLQWYWDHQYPHPDTPHPARLLASLPIRQPDWYDPVEREIINIISRSVKTRYLLNRKLAYSRSYHDRVRIQTQIDNKTRIIDETVLTLYTIEKSHWYRFGGDQDRLHQAEK